MNPSNRSIETPKGLVTVRPAGLGDATAFTELRIEALRDNPTSFGSSYETRENCDLDWALRLLGADPQEAMGFVAEHEGQLVGIANIRRSRGQKLRHAASINGVYIQPDWREMRIVDNLVEACFEWAETNEIAILKLAVVTVNRPALRAYERLGFRHYGTDPKAILHNGIYYDEYLMAREIKKTGTNGR